MISNFIKTSTQSLIIKKTELVINIANPYSNILNKTLYNVAGIIINNQNDLLKRLTSHTIILNTLVLISSIYGITLNIPHKDRHLVFFLSVTLSIIFLGFAIRKYAKKVRR